MSIEKFVIKKEASSFTVIPNKVLQNLTNIKALGLWCYLCSLPPDWEVNKNQLKGHFKIGRDSLDSLINILSEHGLITMRILRNAHGRFSQIHLIVHNGEKFKTIKNNNLKEKCAPRTEKPLTENQLLVNSTYKRNNKKEINKKENIKILCASDDARKSFENFWNIYPRKKDKQRAFKVWIDKNLHEKHEMITNKLIVQIMNDSQWDNPQYVPYAERYLKWERWEDEITPKNFNSSKEKKFNPVSYVIDDLRKDYEKGQLN